MGEKRTSPLKLTVDNDVLGKLDQMALKVRQDIREGKLPKRGPGRSVGAATIAATLIERVVRDYPDLLKEFFEDESPIGTGQHLPASERSHRRTPK